MGTVTEQQSDGSEGSRLTVLVAGGANLLIAVAKLVTGVASGSSAMLSEAAHSFADTLNQAFLMTALRRSRKEADREHPFGYGMERYFWSLLAAVGIFVLGAGFAVYQGIETLVGGAPRAGSPLWSYVVLAVSFVMEGTSFGRALWQLRGDAAAQGVGVLHHLRTEAEPAARAVTAEDFVALVGIVLAAAGLGLRQLTGQDAWDGIASLLIGALLVAVAVGLGRQNQQYLIGRAVSDDLVAAITEELEGTDGIDHVLELLSMRLGPEEVLVAARVDLGGDGRGDDFERVADEADRRIQERFPQVRHVFVDPTPPEHPD